MSEEFNPTDEQVLAWGEKLSAEQKEEAKNQVMYDRWRELMRPRKIDWGSLTAEEFEREKNKVMKQ